MSVVDMERRKNILHTMTHGLPLVVPLPDSLKASVADIPEARFLRMYALPLNKMEAGNGKGIPAFKISLEEEKAGRLKPGMPVYVPSSGSTVLNVAYQRSAFGTDEVVAVLERSVAFSKKMQILLPGASIEYPKEGQNAIDRAYELQKKQGGLVIDQYKHGGSVRGHEWTMDHIRREMKRLRQGVSFFCAGAGTCSTLVAAYEYLKPHYRNLQVVGVACNPGEKVPGCRTLEEIERDITFDWKKAIAPFDMVFCDKKPAFQKSRDLVMSGHLGGPSSGLAVEGFLQQFRKLYETRKLAQFLNRNHEYVVVFVFMDSSLVYPEQYSKVLGIKS